MGKMQAAARLLAVALLVASPCGAGPAPASVPATHPPAEPSGWIPPLDGPLVATSSFGEYRRGHYHGGVDLSTGGRPGMPVHAPAAGRVLRLRASGVGYGKAVYFRLDDGRTVVFAHLSRFVPRVESLVAAEQDRRGRYEVDFAPAESVRFPAGAVLAYSGSTGAGPPHLHAEVRVDPEANRAVNPLGSGGWSVPDTIPPLLRRLRVEPAEPGARVAGGFDPVVLSLSPAGTDTLVITGGVHLWVEALDRAVGGDHRLAPYRVACRVDGERLCEVAFDSVDWRWPREAAWTFHETLARSRNERWIRLEPAPAARQTVCRWFLGEPPFPTGVVPGLHRLVLAASDAAGNHTTRALLLLYRPSSDPGVPARAVLPERTALSSRGTYLEIRTRGADPTPPVVRAEGVPATGPDPVWKWTRVVGGWLGQTGEPPRPGRWTFTVEPEGEGERVPGTAIWVGEGAQGQAAPRSRRDAGTLALEIGPEDVYGSLWVTVREGDGKARSDPARPELVPVSHEVALEPWATPLRNPVRVAIPLPPGTDGKGVALYRWDEGWSFVGADTARGAVGGTITELETMALLRDRTPPRIRVLLPGRKRRPSLVARVSDGGAGFTWRNLAMQVDGEPVVADWDPEAGRFTGHLRRRLGPGKHEWVIAAADRVGNRTEERVEFTVE